MSEEPTPMPDDERALLVADALAHQYTHWQDGRDILRLNATIAADRREIERLEKASVLPGMMDTSKNAELGRLRKLLIHKVLPEEAAAEVDRLRADLATRLLIVAEREQAIAAKDNVIAAAQDWYDKRGSVAAFTAEHAFMRALVAYGKEHPK